MTEIAGRGRALATLAAAGGAGVVGLYLVFVRTPIGQRWDDRALLGGQLASLDSRQALTAALHGVRISTIVLMIVLLLVIGLVRKRLVTAVTMAAAFGFSILSAEVLKQVLPRRDLAPELNAYVDNGNIDTYPSGHATIAMGFALALIVVSSPRYRTAAAAFGMAWAAAVPMAALAAGWHRPSDVMGGMALALMWLAGATAIALRRRGIIDTIPGSTRLLPLIAAAVAIGALIALTAWVLAGDSQEVPVSGGLVAFVSAEILIALVAVLVVSVFAYVVRGLSFPHRGNTSPIAS